MDVPEQAASGRFGRGRRAVSKLGGGLRTLRGRRGVAVDDDPEAELIDTEVEDDEELVALDNEEQGKGGFRPPEWARIEGPAELWALFGRIDPGPDLPVAEAHSVGLGPLLSRLCDLDTSPSKKDWATRRVISLVGDRYTITVAPDGITVRGLLRRRRTPWEKMNAIGVMNRYEAFKSGAISQLVDNSVRLPVPGLRWLLNRILTSVTSRIEEKVLGDDDIAAWRDTSGVVVTDIDRRGFDIELGGPLFAVSLLATGTTAALVAEARQRGIEIVEDD